MINVIYVCSTIFTVVICVLNYVAANAKANECLLYTTPYFGRRNIYSNHDGDISRLKHLNKMNFEIRVNVLSKV